MNKKTTFCFLGDIVKDFPELMISSYKMAIGDKISWINASCKLASSVGDIIKLHIDKNNTKILKTEIDKLNTESLQDSIEQEFLAKKLQTIREIQSDFENHQKELQVQYNDRKFFEYMSAITQQEEISKIETCILDGLKKLMDICDEELAKIEKDCEFNLTEKRNLEETKRLLYKQYIKHIKTEV